MKNVSAFRHKNRVTPHKHSKRSEGGKNASEKTYKSHRCHGQDHQLGVITCPKFGPTQLFQHVM